MKDYTYLFQSVTSTNIKKFEAGVQHFLSLGYYIVSGNIITATVIKTYFPLRIETQYTAFLQKHIVAADKEDL